MEIQWPLTFFSTLAGCGGIVLAFVGLSELLRNAQKSRVPAVVVSLVLTVVGGCCSILHLAQRANIMAAAANIFSFSPISLELIFVGLTCIVCIVYLLFARQGSEAVCKWTAVIGIVIGLVLAFVTGDGYRMEAQPSWNSPLLPISYVFSDLAFGSMVFLLIAVVRKEEGDVIGRYARFASVCVILAVIGYVAYSAFTQLAVNPFVMWIGCVLVGVVIPLCCTCPLWMGRFGEKAKGRALPLVTIGVVASFIGAVCLRIAMWLLGTGWLELFEIAAEHTLM